MRESARFTIWRNFIYAFNLARASVACIPEFNLQTFSFSRVPQNPKGLFRIFMHF